MINKDIFKKEIKSLIFSKSIFIYFSIIYVPLVANIWFSYKIHNNAPIIDNLVNQLFFKEITEFSPKIALMIHLGLSVTSIALVSILYMTDTLAGEKERRTMSLLVSKPIKRSKIILSKYTAFLCFLSISLFSSVAIMAASVSYLGIGSVGQEVFLAYLLASLLFGVVYSSIATLFSSISKKSVHSNLLSILVLVMWRTLDFLIIYLPWSLRNDLEEFSLSHHINKVVGYLTDGEVSLFSAGANAVVPSDVSFLYSIACLVIIGFIVPLFVSIFVFNRQDT